MTLVLDNDYLVFDNTESVTHVSIRAAGNLADAIANALRHQVTERDAIASGGVYTTQDVAWNLPAIQAANAPKPGDTITDSDAVVWTILQVDRATLKTRWRCTSRDLILANDLRHTVEIWAPQYSDNQAGGRVPVYIPQQTGLAARVQELAADRIEERGKRGTRRQYEIYLAFTVAVTTDHQVRHDGTIYEIIGYREPDQIGSLMVLSCERKFEGQ